METKICTKCERELPATNEYFFKSKYGKCGYNSACKNCIKEYREKNKQHIKEHKRKYYQNNKEEIEAKRRERRLLTNPKFEIQDGYKKCPKCGDIKLKNEEYFHRNKSKVDGFASYCKICTKEYMENNKELIRKRKAIYYIENSEIIKEKASEYRNNNREKVKKTQKNFYQNNKQKLQPQRLLQMQKRLARKKDLPATLTVEQWELIKEDFRHQCAYCGEELKLEQEHFIPLSKGGEYTHNNIIPACRSCNASKHNKDFFEWYPTYEHYNKKREKFILEYLGYTEDTQQLSIL